MDFQQHRQYATRDISYHAEFDFVDDQLSNGVYKLRMILKLILNVGSEQEKSALIQSTENLIVGKTELKLRSNESTHSIEIYMLNKSQNGKLIVNVPTGSAYKKYHIKIPAPKKLHICRNLAEGDDVDEVIEMTKNHYDKEGSRIYYEILDDASKCLRYEDYLAVRDSLVGYESRLKTTVEGDRKASIRNMVLGRRKGKYFKIDSSAELWDRVTTYNHHNNLEKIEERSLIQFLFKSRYIKNYEQIDKSAIWDELRRVMSDSEFIERSSNILDGSSDESEYYFASYFADLLRVDALNKAKELVDMCVRCTGDFNYETEMSRLLDNNKYRRYGERADRFKQLLPEAARRNPHEFKFVAANYLFWRGREYHALPRNDECPLEIQAFLFSVAESLISNIEGPASIREQAEYFTQLSEGHLYKFDVHDEAATRYLDAIAIAQDQDSAWIGSRYRYLIPPFRSRAETLADKFDENEDYTEGVQFLERQIELLESWNEVEESQQNYAIELLKGQQLEMKAHQELQLNDVKASIDSAKEKFGHANHRFKKIERKDLQAGAHARIKELEALEAEFHGNFDNAATAHNEYCKKYPETRAARYHKQAATVCLVKQSLIDGDVKQAKRQMDEFQENAEYLTDSQHLLDILVELVYDYHTNTTTDHEMVFERLDNISTGDTHLLSVNTEYTTGISQVMAAQRTEEKGELLDRLIKRSIRNALIPVDVEEYSREYVEINLPLQRASVGDWKKELPLNVYDKLNNLEEDQNSVRDLDALVFRCFVALERLLMAVVEYHCKREWAEDWKIELYDQLYDEPDYDKDPALGTLFEFFYYTPGKSVSNVDEIQRQDNAEIIDGITIKSMRNTIAHGEQLRVASSWDEYEMIRDAIYDLFKTLLPVTPRAAEINRILRDEVVFELLKTQPPHQVTLSYNGPLDDNEIYYLPPEIDEGEVEKFNGEDIFICEYPKGLNEVLKHSV